MNYIDEKFKDEKPEITVQKIIDKLNDLGIHINEKWNDSKIENCCSLRISVDGGIPGTNGKGVTPALARASAYGEFMERMQSGLFFYKQQSFENDDTVYLHHFAPDKKYFTKAELLANSEWMEPICKAYNLTKEAIASACQIFNCSEKILMLPYYSLFEDKYVYLPAMFVEHIYTANGCCVGNTKEEAWVHALSEIFERNSSLTVLKSGKPVPIIPREKLKNFKVVNKILDRIETEGKYSVELLDYSCGKQFPVIGTRIINKETKGYLVNVAADPVFEIAVERTLTEIFQGRNIDNFTSMHDGRILTDISEIKTLDNVYNQVETGNGVFTVDFFAGTNEADDTDSFVDNSNKTNKELIEYILDKYRKMGLNIYVRNNSFLGFHCYKFIVPGYSDIRIDRVKQPIPDYYFGNRASKVLKNIKSASKAELSELLVYRNMIEGFISKKSNYNNLSGLPFAKVPKFAANVHFLYAALRCENYALAKKFIENSIYLAEDNVTKEYLMALRLWMDFNKKNVSSDKIFKMVNLFYNKDICEKLKENLKNDTVLDEFLVECNDNCYNCSHSAVCNKERIREIIGKIGAEYSKFSSGQDKENFII